MAKSFNKALAFTLVLGLAACASPGPTDNPVLRNLTWDRYVGGDDIFRACVPQQPAKYRLVYNARQDDQQRTYDLSELPDGGAMLETRVMGRGYLNKVLLTDPLAPWRGEQALYRLSPADYSQFKAALTATGFEGPTPEGLFLRGDTFYWTASSCRDGKFHFNAWAWPDENFTRMAVPLLHALAPFDKTAEKPIEPYEVPLPPYSIYLDRRGGQPMSVPHRYIVGKYGLRYSQGTLN